ncbi:MAG: NAD-dependent epimerase/dehydratase family protein, partial [Gemmatimonadota bacterium]|nr:NAD-dependent epimerase/dehydratase family protein [Gemmatimonadota bacterium]
MHAFLTGGTGFLGGELVRLLVGGGWKVTALHRPSSEMTRLRAAAVTPVEGTLEDADSLRRAMPEGVDAVFHVAAVVSFWSRRDQEQTRANVIGTRNVVEAALASGAGRFVHTSSIAAFGRHAGIITESTPSNAASSDIRYLQTKALAEEEVRRGMDRGLDAVFLNPANILGPGDSAHWAKLLQMVDRGHLPGLPPGRGSFCHVREVALAHLRAFERGRTGHHYLLGGADADYAVVAREAARILGRTIPERTLPLW